LPQHDRFNKQGYWTPPEEETDIPALPQFDENLLLNAPPELLRGNRSVPPWMNDSGSVGVPSDIIVERGGPEDIDSGAMRNMGRYYGPPVGDFNNMSLLDRPQLSPIKQSPGMMEENPYIFHGDPMNQRFASHEQMYNDLGNGPISETGSHGSRRSFYGGCGYSRDYFRNLSGEFHLQPRPRPSPPGMSPSSGRHHPSPPSGHKLITSNSSPNLAKNGMSSPGRNLLHPTGSPASEASKSPQRSPRSQRGGQWGHRSYQNPIGSVYHEPDETEWNWATRAKEDEPWRNAESSGWAAAQSGDGWNSTHLPEEDRAWAGRNMVPYETLSGANYPSRFEYGWGRLGPGDGYYVSPRTPPMYTSALSPPSQVTSLAPFLPQRGPTQQYYPGNSPYSSQGGYPPVPTPNHISPNSQRRDRTGPKSGRPYSADVGRLLSVQEGSEGSEKSQKPKGHRRSSSYGSTSEMAANMRYPEDIRHGNSYTDLQRPLSHEAEYYYGSRETMLDTACEFLAPDLRPVPPQPNCPQSMKIYEDHRQMAAEYLRVKTELSELRKYKTQLTEKIKENKEVENLSTPTQEDSTQFTQLKSEKEALLAFREKLTEQLTLIEAAQTKKSGSAHSTGGSTDGWVVVNSKPPDRNT